MLVRTSPLMPTLSRMFNDDWHKMADWSQRGRSTVTFTRPAVNIQETDDAYHISVAAPGMKKEDFHIELKDHTLTIKSEHTTTDESEEHWTRREFNYSAFSRSFNLEHTLVDEQTIDATYEDGILLLTLPKLEEAKVDPVRRIEIR